MASKPYHAIIALQQNSDGEGQALVRRTNGDDIVIKREDVLRILAEHKGELRAMGVVSLDLFGSLARNEAKKRSDVDLLVDIDPEKHIGLFGFVRIQQRLEELLGVSKVDLTMRDCLHEELKDDILREAIRVT